MNREAGELRSDEDVHASGPATGIAALCWEALRDAAAAEEAERNALSAETDERLTECLPFLWELVWRVAGGAEPKLTTAPPASAAALLERARRSFVGRVRQEQQAAEILEIFRVLEAIDRVHLAVLGPPRPSGSAAASPERTVAGDPSLSLLTDVARDLRAPLTSIVFLAESLRAGRGTPIDVAQERQLLLIYSAALESSMLTDDLAELGQPADHLLEHEPIPFSVEGTIRSVCEIVYPVAEERGVEIRLTGLPVEHRVGHPAALGRVVLNLVLNALRRTETGWVEVGVRRLSASRLEFDVIDTGAAIPGAVLDNLNTPFDASAMMRLTRATSASLALAICRRLLTVMGSDLRSSILADRGPAFHFALELPVAPEWAERAALAPRAD